MTVGPYEPTVRAAATAADGVEIHATIDAVSRLDWERLAPADDPLWTWSFFRAMETGGVGATGFEYLLFRRDGRVRAIVPTFRYDGVCLVNNVDPEWRRRLCRLPFLSADMMFCGHPLGGGTVPGLVGEDAPAAAQILSALWARATHHDRRWILAKDLFPQALERLAPGAVESGFFEVPSFPEAVLHLGGVEAGGFETYLAGLRSKARRNARRNLRKFATAQAYRLERSTDLAPLVAPMTDLYRQVFARARVTLDSLDEGFFAAMAGQPGLDRELVAAWRGDRLVGFLLCLYAGRGAVALRVGVDDRVPSDSRLYFALHYEAIRAALDRGCRTLNFCQASYEPKIEMGCRLETRTHLVTHTHPLVRPVLRATMPGMMAAQLPAPPPGPRSERPGGSA